MKIGDRVKTKDGEGIIVDVEHYNRLNGGINRWGIKLDVDRYSHPTVYYFENEICVTD